MKDLLIEFVEIGLGAKDKDYEEFEALMERVMDGEFKEEWSAYFKGRFDDM